MDKEYIKYIDDLNNGDKNIRIESLKKLKNTIDSGKIERPGKGNDVNNHIHTTYSFSPYSPSKAVWMAYNAGLETAGIMDHDSISGALEFADAGKIMGMASTVGLECRADFSDTPLNGKTINNPDQDSIAYVAIHGVPHTKIDMINQYFAPFREKRNIRNASMVDRINKILKPYGIYIDFDNDVKPLSMCHEGGSITERHILYALSLKLVKEFGRGKELVGFLKNTLKLGISGKVEGYLLDPENPFYEYDLLGGLKSDMVPLFYIEAREECPGIKDVSKLCRETGSILAYPYLGDITDSVTGDKKSKKFEDGYLDLLFDTIKDIGFNAVTYMPSRNTMEQLKRVKSMCDKYGLFQISGEDINSPRQPFICTAARDKEFSNLYDSTWALIGHEIAATRDIECGMFSESTVKEHPDLNERVAVFKKIGMNRI